MTNNDNLVLEVRPDQLVPYHNLRVAFFDSVVGGKPTLYIHIQNSEDMYSIVKRKAGERRGKGGQIAEETALFARAYTKYLEVKENKDARVSRENDLEAEIARLKAKIDVDVDLATERSCKDLKAELDILGVEYKGNASRASLEELLFNAKEK